VSRSALRAVVDNFAFDSFPRFDDLWRYHVPFDELLPGTGPHKGMESEVSAAARRGDRVAVVGPSGAGKSSIMSYVTSPLQEGVAPIRVPVRTENEVAVTDPRAFAQHVLATVARRSAEATQISEAERDKLLRAASDRVVAPARRGVKGSLTLPLWLLGGGVAAEVSSAAGPDASFSRSGAEVFEQLGRVLELIGDHGLLPVLVIDDSDAWLRVSGEVDRTPVASRFFREVPRQLAELPCSVLFGVHEQYRQLPGYREAVDVLGVQVELPPLDDGAVSRILDARLRLHTKRFKLGNVMTTDAVVALASHYRAQGRYSLRRVFNLANVAVRLALTEESDLVTGPLLDSALAELGAPA
jgi:hypothetical protein